MASKVHLLLAGVLGLSCLAGSVQSDEEYANQIRPLLVKYCLQCHSTAEQRGELDLERFTQVEDIRRDLEVWPKVIAMLNNGEMPPKKQPQPSSAARTQIVEWTRQLLDSEARANRGDPGRVVLRRLSNAQYDYSIRDLTGVDLQPAAQFPVDSAAGEGFTNAGEALVMSPALLEKYFEAAKNISRHAVLLPGGIRFSRYTTRRDWTDEIVQKIRAFYDRYTERTRREWMYGDIPVAAEQGQIPMAKYIRATIQYRQQSQTNGPDLNDLAAQNGLSKKYLQALWNVFSSQTDGNSFLLDDLRARWQSLAPEDSEKLAAEIGRWQTSLWKFNSVGHMNQWLEPVTPLATTENFTVPIVAGNEGEKVIVYLAVGDAGDGNADDFLVWKRPRFEGNPITEPGKDPRPSDLPPILLADLPVVITCRGPQRKQQVVFGQHPDNQPLADDSFIVQAPAVVEIPVPQELVGQRQLVVDVELDTSIGTVGSVQAQIRLDKMEPTAGIILPVLTNDANPEANGPPIPGKYPIILQTDQRKQEFADAFSAHRKWFPPAVCYTQIVPVDEGITITLFHREDKVLSQFLLEAKETQQLDQLWHELRYVSQDALTIYDSFDDWWNYGAHYGKFSRESRELPIRQQAERFQEELRGSQSQHVDAVLELAERAYRRPLSVDEKVELLELYRSLTAQDVTHNKAIRKMVSWILVSSSFLYRIEEPAPGNDPQPVSSWELASRLSYFLWSSMPDAELKHIAARGMIKDPEVLAAQTRRMLQHPRALAIEFAAQWLGFRKFDQHAGVNEIEFPEFVTLRPAMYEESLLFFSDIIAGDLPVTQILDADHTFLNEQLANHYGIPNVIGPHYRRVEGLKQHGRGGVLGMATILTKQSGASRTSPVLRGNWVFETLLGNQLPKPPPDVPQLPEHETDTDGFTVRQLVEKHRSVAQCAGCHNKIDPLGFSLEGFDPIGRRRQQDLANRPIDADAEISHETELVQFTGIAGLRNYLLQHRREELLNNFCHKLLGYALGRAVELSDEALILEMRKELEHNDDRFSAAVLAVVNSKQFRYHRGRDIAEEN